MVVVKLLMGTLYDRKNYDFSLRTNVKDYKLKKEDKPYLYRDNWKVFGKYSINEDIKKQDDERYEAVWKKICEIGWKVSGIRINDKETFYRLVNQHHPEFLDTLRKDSDIINWIDNPYRHDFFHIGTKWNTNYTEYACIPDLSYDKYGFDTLFNEPNASPEQGMAFMRMRELHATHFGFKNKIGTSYLSGYTLLNQPNLENHASLNHSANNQPQFLIRVHNTLAATANFKGNKIFADYIKKKAKLHKGGSFSCLTNLIPEENPGGGHAIGVTFIVDDDGRISGIIPYNSNLAGYEYTVRHYVWPLLVSLENDKEILSNKFSAFVQEGSRHKISKKEAKKFIKESHSGLKIQENDEQCIRHAANYLWFSKYMQSGGGREWDIEDPYERAQAEKKIFENYPASLKRDKDGNIGPVEPADIQLLAALRSNEWKSEQMKRLMVFADDISVYEEHFKKSIKDIFFKNDSNINESDIDIGLDMSSNSSEWTFTATVSVKGRGCFPIAKFINDCFQQSMYSSMAATGGNNSVKVGTKVFGINIIDTMSRMAGSIANDQEYAREVIKEYGDIKSIIYKTKASVDKENTDRESAPEPVQEAAAHRVSFTSKDVEEELNTSIAPASGKQKLWQDIFTGITKDKGDNDPYADKFYGQGGNIGAMIKKGIQDTNALNKIKNKVPLPSRMDFIKSLGKEKIGLH